MPDVVRNRREEPNDVIAVTALRSRSTSAVTGSVVGKGGSVIGNLRHHLRPPVQGRPKTALEYNCRRPNAPADELKGIVIEIADRGLYRGGTV
jgi:hypothetical protein